MQGWNRFLWRNFNGFGMICVSIAHMRQIRMALGSGAGLLELRLDLIGEKPDALYREIPDGVETIATCRPGKWNDHERIEVLEGCMEQGATWIDVEVEAEPAYLKELQHRRAGSGTGLIISYHDFERTPGRKELESMIRQCYDRGGVIAKIATMVRSREELLELLSLYDLPGRKVVIGMGETGRISRIMAPYLGAEFTFASMEEQGQTAPGQFTLQQLTELYKVIDNS